MHKIKYQWFSDLNLLISFKVPLIFFKDEAFLKPLLIRFHIARNIGIKQSVKHLLRRTGAQRFQIFNFGKPVHHAELGPGEPSRNFRKLFRRIRPRTLSKSFTRTENNAAKGVKWGKVQSLAEDTDTLKRPWRRSVQLKVRRHRLRRLHAPRFKNL